MPKNAKRLYCFFIQKEQGATMARGLKIVFILSLLIASLGCGQSGDLYIPTKNTAQQSES